MSNQRPRIQFNEKGFCSPCVFRQYKNKFIDWDKREKELSALCDKHRKDDGTWDVIVPSSGGKDSSYVSYMLKEKYGMKPLTVYTTPKNDLHKDHQIVFESTLIASRPHSTTVKNLFSYEIPGIVKNPFTSTVYEDISKEISFKIKAFKCYKSEIEKFPHPRSIEALSCQRGMESGLIKAESFELIKSIRN